MSRKGRALILSIVTQEELESFVTSYRIPSNLLPSLPGPNDPVTYSSERIVIYTLSFSFSGVRYPLSLFKINLLKHYGIHFSQLHPLAFLRIVHFELSCAAFYGVTSVPLFRRFYRLRSNGDWFTFEKRKVSVSLPCYSFMPTSTYLKEWKNQFIFVSPLLLSEHLPARDPATVVEDDVPSLSSVEDALWKRMYENSTRAFNFPEGIIAMGGLNPFYPNRLKAFLNGREMSLWNLMHADVKGVKFVVDAVENQEMGVILGGEAPDVGGQDVEVVHGDWNPLFAEASPKGSEDSQNFANVENINNGDEDLETRLSHKRKFDPDVGTSEAVPEVRNIRSRLRSASNKKSQPTSQTRSEAPPVATKGSLSKHLKVLRPSLSLVS
ncbi:hypothetical protein HanPI659440_Chr15g0613251 [Helianthus annuus]|nr:hypothetical protein HanPI659440_Chr15g0613251 [Helianthus annuus]